MDLRFIPRESKLYVVLQFQKSMVKKIKILMGMPYTERDFD